MRQPVRRLLAYLLLALSLALAGPGAYAHALTHLDEAQHQHEGEEHELGHACELCAAFSGAGTLGAAPAPLGLGAAAAAVASPHCTERPIPCEALARFASRAPPLSR